MKLFIFLILSFINLAQAQTLPDIEEILISANGVQIPCKFFGQGDPIIILHGGPGVANDDFTPNLLELSKTHLIIFYYQRGSGSSPEKQPLEKACWDLYLNDLVALQKTLGLEKTTLLGHCWGCGLAMKYAMKYPELVDQLIFIAPMPVSTSELDLSIKGFLKASKPYREQLSILKKSSEFIDGNLQTLQEYYSTSLKVHFYNPENTKLLLPLPSSERFEKSQKSTHFFLRNELTRPFDWFKELNQFTFPTLIIQGTHDFIPLIISQKIHENIPNSQYVLIEECGHSPLIEKQQETVKHIQTFLSKNSKS